MTADQICSILDEKLGPKIKAKKLDVLDPYVEVDPADLIEVCRFLRDDPRLGFDQLNDITGVDYLEPDAKQVAKAGFEPHVEVVYHFSSFRNLDNGRIRRFTVKVVLPRWKDGKAGALPEVPSLTPLWKIADWHEREVYDLVGVWFTGHPDLRRILLAEAWVGPPLRKDYEFPLEYHGTRGR
jgi:NADH-quinone oxidoreductase subunit C